MAYSMGNQPFPGGQQMQQMNPAPGPPGMGPGMGMGQAPGQYQQQQQGMMMPQGGQQQYGAQNPQSQHYGQYGQNFQQNIFSVNAWQAMQFNSENEFVQAFEMNKSQVFQAIQAQELMTILNTTPQIRNYYKISWSLELCKIMLAMLDRSKDGMMQFAEFKELLQCLVYWYQTFCQYDQNRSGYMEACELGRCFKERFGYCISAKAMECILKRYARAMDDGRLLVAFDDFVSCSVRLRAYTEAFRGRDRNCHGGQETGSTQFGYDDFIQCVMCL